MYCLLFCLSFFLASLFVDYTYFVCACLDDTHAILLQKIACESWFSLKDWSQVPRLGKWLYLLSRLTCLWRFLYALFLIIISKFHVLIKLFLLPWIHFSSLKTNYRVILPNVDTQFSQHHFLKRLSFLQWMFLARLLNQDTSAAGLFLNLVLCQCHVFVSVIWDQDCATVVLRHCFAIGDLCVLHGYWRSSIFISLKNIIKCLGGFVWFLGVDSYILSWSF